MVRLASHQPSLLESETTVCGVCRVQDTEVRIGRAECCPSSSRPSSVTSPSLRNNKYKPWGSPPSTRGNPPPLSVTSLDSPIYTRSEWAALSLHRESQRPERSNRLSPVSAGLNGAETNRKFPGVDAGPMTKWPWFQKSPATYESQGKGLG